jgi:hypothetical protein
MILIYILLIILILYYILVYDSSNPHMYHTTFYTSDDYIEMKYIETNWRVFRDEIPPFDKNDPNIIMRDRSAWNNLKGMELVKSLKNNKSWTKGWWNNIEWYQYPLMYHGNVIGHAEEMCPKSIEILKKYPPNVIQIAGFALLLPNTRMPSHTDDTGKKNYSFACNLALTNNDANLYVNDIKYKHNLGKMVIFDSNEPHYAENNDNKDFRVILYIDFKTDTLYSNIIRSYKNIYHLQLSRSYDYGYYLATSEYGYAYLKIKNNISNCVFIDDVYINDNWIYFWNLTTVSTIIDEKYTTLLDMIIENNII